MIMFLFFLIIANYFVAEKANSLWCTKGTLSHKFLKWYGILFQIRSLYSDKGLLLGCIKWNCVVWMTV